MMPPINAAGLGVWLGVGIRTTDGGGAIGEAFQPGDALLLDDGVSFLLLGGTTDKLLLAPQ